MAGTAKEPDYAIISPAWQASYALGESGIHMGVGVILLVLTYLTWIWCESTYNQALTQTGVVISILLALASFYKLVYGWKCFEKYKQIRKDAGA